MEARPLRRGVLGIAGLSRRLESGDGSAEPIVARVVQGAEAYVHDIFADDVCLIVGVAVGPYTGAGSGQSVGPSPMPTDI